MSLEAVIACDRERLVGAGDGLPWHCPADLAHFRALTWGHPLVMGRRTFDGIVRRRGSPLPGRAHWVLTHRPLPAWEAVHGLARLDPELWAGETVWFAVGGPALWSQCLPWLDRLWLSLIPGVHAGDVTLPDLGAGWTVERTEEREEFQLLVLVRDPAAHFDWQAFAPACIGDSVPP